MPPIVVLVDTSIVQFEGNCGARFSASSSLISRHSCPWSLKATTAVCTLWPKHSWHICRGCGFERCGLEGEWKKRAGEGGRERERERVGGYDWHLSPVDSHVGHITSSVNTVAKQLKHRNGESVTDEEHAGQSQEAKNLQENAQTSHLARKMLATSLARGQFRVLPRERPYETSSSSA